MMSAIANKEKWYDKLRLIMNRPFIQLFYDLKDHWIFTTENKPEYVKAFMLLCLNANHSVSTRLIAGKTYQINPGEIFFSAETFGIQSGLGSKASVSRFLTLLEQEGIIQKLHKHKEPTRLKICNFVNFSGNYIETKTKPKWKDYNNENNEITYLYKCFQCGFTKEERYPDISMSCTTCNQEMSRSSSVQEKDFYSTK